MYIVNHKIDRQFNTFEDALNYAIEEFEKHFWDYRHKGKKHPYIVKKTPKGWTVKDKNPYIFNHCSYSLTQFIQEVI